MIENPSNVVCTFHTSEEFKKTINQHEFFLENQIQDIQNDHESQYRLYVLKLINIDTVHQLECALAELKNNEPANHFQDDYDLGIFLEGFELVFPKILDFHRQPYSKPLQDAPFIFLIDLA